MFFPLKIITFWTYVYENTLKIYLLQLKCIITIDADVISVRNNVRNKFKDKDSLMAKDEFIVLQLLKDYGLIEQHEIFEKYINGLRSQFFKDVDKYENDTSSDDELHPYKMMHLQSDDSNNFMDDVSILFIIK